MVWDPDAYKTGRVEFMEEELNKLHQEKIKNEAKPKDEFEKRVNDTNARRLKKILQKQKNQEMF